MQRCGWVTQDPLYLAYHDREWGVVQRDKRALFEMLCLEGQQAGLSWITVLKKRENYRAAFHQFDPQAIALMDSTDIDALMLNSGIIRHAGKIAAIIANARAYLEMETKGEDFSHFVWQFVDNVQIVHDYPDYSQAPTTSEHAIALSKALKQRGFKFIGPTICYSFMQACGLINDHQSNCFCHPDNQKT
ncbi:DNA-3-methyladenine glycosylase I [Pantoea eucalypti]|jgi:DNA-3-methyladenine glycosylase I|uniref:DNA-3-methyladenine glycosylase I n=1 Tax=Pantoea eucalypti TaxID=470933 RepID=A0ABY2ZMH7_9GAMM|nr:MULTISPECIES: DNA-3-methyladenine glycosylase I [Pantoea]AWP31085.1 DNA-3-methyladenine glycosylase I [Pantoea vagans]EFM18698.1 DNA-3-methyladenine glycosylase I [Pantoea sp. aB]ELP26171.1 DNA-3-methyladenine glycosylase [Pantoea agglomerans 299R]MBD9554508.1 DNA-3-methyladenine glycosylase I [Pantoea sp. PNT01]MDJ0474303.1 DNA-3-methyladenine glycosylase I [Pantoea eucalypti]